jgi:hypothetical protein
MKKITLSIFALIAIASQSVAQSAPDFGFETWVATPSPSSSTDPQGWVSFNALTLAGMPQTVFPETTTPYAGTKSVKVVTDVIPSTVLIPNPFNPLEDLDTIGLVTIGRFTAIFPPVIKYGYSYTNSPATLNFASKYTPNGNDSAFVLAYLTKWNVNHRDTIARGTYSTGATTSTYAVNSITMVYNPLFLGATPDTQHVYISSSVYSHPGAKKGSEFYVDALQWTGGTIGTNDLDKLSNNVYLYPNPATTSISVKSELTAEKFEIIDITGRLVSTYQMNDKKITIQTHHLAPGIYIYNLYNEQKTIIGRGKFEIAK